MLGQFVRQIVDGLVGSKEVDFDVATAGEQGPARRRVLINVRPDGVVGGQSPVRLPGLSALSNMMSHRR